MITVAEPGDPSHKADRLYLFLDTEFVPVGEHQALLSIGLCDFYGREFYCEAQDAPKGPTGNEVVDALVLPQLGQAGALVLDTASLVAHLARWLRGLNSQEVEVCYDFHADFDMFEELLSAQDSMPLRLIPVHVGYLLGQPEGEVAAGLEWARQEAERGFRRHHALADANALRARFAAVHGVPTE